MLIRRVMFVTQRSADTLEGYAECENAHTNESFTFLVDFLTWVKLFLLRYIFSKRNSRFEFDFSTNNLTV